MDHNERDNLTKLPADKLTAMWVHLQEEVIKCRESLRAAEANATRARNVYNEAKKDEDAAWQALTAIRVRDVTPRGA